MMSRQQSLVHGLVTSAHNKAVAYSSASHKEQFHTLAHYIYRAVVALFATVSMWFAVGALLPTPAQSREGARPVHTYTVQPGDTLWSYAARITPEGSNVNDTVESLMYLNNLDSANLYVGQRILIPVQA